VVPDVILDLPNSTRGTQYITIFLRFSATCACGIVNGLVIFYLAEDGCKSMAALPTARKGGS
jgi:hypothetical protein